jgi:hypothetical protein
MTFVASGTLQMRAVPEIVKAEGGSKRSTVLHPVRFRRVTRSADGDLVVGLMCVTGVALRMLRHAGLQALFVESVAEITPWRALEHLAGVHLPFHLFRVRMVAMREALESELYKLWRKRDPRSLGVNRNFVADDAQLAFQIRHRHIFLVTYLARRVFRKHWLGIVGRPHVAGGAVLRLGLVLFAIVIEGRDDFDHLRLHDVEWRLAHGSGRRRAVDGRIQVLLGASTRANADEQDERCSRYSL